MSNADNLKEVHLLHVNEYHDDRAYGGHEEGGWWYDTSKFVACLGKTIDRAAAETIRDAHAERIDEINEGKPSISSVLSEGERVIRIEYGPGENYPTFRPYYE